MRSPICTLVIALSLLPACENEEKKETTTHTGGTTHTTGAETTGGTTTHTGTTGAHTTTHETAGTETGTHTGTTGAETSGTTGGVPPGGVCATDKDCVLHSDCCECFATTKPDEAAKCDKPCDKPLCELEGITKAICHLGTCVTNKVSCNPLDVSCDTKPPTCPMGERPSVKDKCWTGHCVAATDCET